MRVLPAMCVCNRRTVLCHVCTAVDVLVLGSMSSLLVLMWYGGLVTTAYVYYFLYSENYEGDFLIFLLDIYCIILI